MQRRLLKPDVRLLRPGENAPPQAHLVHRHHAAGAANVQLDPAAALVVEGLKTIAAHAADEARPAIEVRVQQRRAADGVALLHHQFDRRSSRRIDGEIRPARHLLGQLEGQRRGARAVQFHAPLALRRLSRRTLADGFKCVGRAALEVLLGGPLPRLTDCLGTLT